MLWQAVSKLSLFELGGLPTGSVANFAPTCQFKCFSGSAHWNVTGAGRGDII